MRWVYLTTSTIINTSTASMVAGSQIVLPFLIAYVGGFIYFMWKGIDDDDT